MCDYMSKTLDCVQSMRQIRDRLSGKIATLAYNELVQWLRSYHYGTQDVQ